MGKYENASRLLGAALAGFPIAVVPGFYVSTGNSEFARVSTIFGVSDVNLKSAVGSAVIDLFTAVNTNPNSLCDELDRRLVMKFLSGQLELTNSTRGSTVPDKANPSLRMTRYTINFNYYEEI